MNLRMTIPVLLAAMLAGCDSSSTTTGTSSETVTGVRLYLPSGAPASGARAEVFAVSDTGRVPVAQVFADAQGLLSLRAPKNGRYNLVIRHPDGASLLQDSLLSDGSRISAWSDTLRPAGSVQGRVKVQPKDSPRIAWVHLLGSGVYANVDDSGRFDLEGVAPGRYTAAFLTQDTAYTPTFRSARVWPDSSLDLGTVDLVYTGLPLVTGLAASYDTAEGVLTLKWDRSRDPRVSAYAVYDGVTGSLALSETVRVSDTSRTLRIFPNGGMALGPNGYLSSGDTTVVRRSYRIAVVDSAGHVGPAWGSVSMEMPSPFLAAGVSVAWTRVGDRPADMNYLGLDTLDGHLLVYSVHRYGEGRTATWDIWESADGASWEQTESELPQQPTLQDVELPLVWHGRLYRLELHLRDSLLASDSWPDKGPRYDSARVMVRTGAGSWDTAWSLVLPDSVNHVLLKSTGGELHLLATYHHRFAAGYATSVLKADMRLESNGRSSISSLFSKAWPNSEISGGLKSFRVGASGSWTLASVPSGGVLSWLRPGLEAVQGASTSLPYVCARASFAEDGDRVYLMGNGCDMSARVGEPLRWGQLPMPEAGSIGALWNGKLVSIGNDGIYLGTLPPR